ncbi:MAG: hypothetical protein JWO46_2130 [Nocardioidaceae bacterium]|nr:hypothetical protein [Nocardioidaceae bacterium]
MRRVVASAASFGWLRHRIATGSAAVNDIRAALVARIAELDEWAPVSNAVDSPG